MTICHSNFISFPLPFFCTIGISSLDWLISVLLLCTYPFFSVCASPIGKPTENDICNPVKLCVLWKCHKIYDAFHFLILPATLSLSLPLSFRSCFGSYLKIPALKSTWYRTQYAHIQQQHQDRKHSLSQVLVSAWFRSLVLFDDFQQIIHGFPLLNLPLPSILPALLKLMRVCVSKQFIVKQVHKLGFYRSRRIIVFRYPHFGGVAQTAAALEKKLTIWKMPNFRIQIISATYRFYYSHTHQPNANKNKHSPFFASACVKIAHKNHSFIWIFCYICAFFLFSLMEQKKTRLHCENYWNKKRFSIRFMAKDQ